MKRRKATMGENLAKYKPDAQASECVSRDTHSHGNCINWNAPFVVPPLGGMMDFRLKPVLRIACAHELTQIA